MNSGWQHQGPHSHWAIVPDADELGGAPVASATLIEATEATLELVRPLLLRCKATNCLRDAEKMSQDKRDALQTIVRGVIITRTRAAA